jgi:hypothetical protein
MNVEIGKEAAQIISGNICFEYFRFSVFAVCDTKIHFLGFDSTVLPARESKLPPGIPLITF